MFAIGFCNFDDRDIERTAAEVVNRDSRIARLLVHTVGKRRRSWLVDNALHVETSNAARIFSRLTLGIVKVGRHSDNRLGYRLAQEIFGGLLHLLQGLR